ncbi:MAG: ribose-5-phosphate isomerase RpiA [Nitriliruptor sp.]|nr:MAG: ribose-5-phosphate isomerase RpiA [Nitriliruptor sp.]
MSDVGKRAAGEAAAELVEDGMRLGLGTGSTVAYFLDALAARGLDVAGVPTSEATAARCRELGIGLLDTAGVARLDLCVDGADELDHALQLTKGGGGALLREKVVATLSDRFVVIATADKLVDRLCDTFALPIEVVPFAVGPVTRSVQGLGFEASVRMRGDAAYRTDNGNAIVDARCDGGVDDPAVIDVTIGLLPGVVETGLFIDLADLALLGDDNGEVTRVTTVGEPDR